MTARQCHDIPRHTMLCLGHCRVVMRPWNTVAPPRGVGVARPWVYGVSSTRWVRHKPEAMPWVVGCRGNPWFAAARSRRVVATSWVTVATSWSALARPRGSKHCRGKPWVAAGTHGLPWQGHGGSWQRHGKVTEGSGNVICSRGNVMGCHGDNKRCRARAWVVMALP